MEDAERRVSTEVIGGTTHPCRKLRSGPLLFRDGCRFRSAGVLPGNQLVEIVVEWSVGPEACLVEKSLNSAAQTDLISMALGAYRPTHFAVPAATQ